MADISSVWEPESCHLIFTPKSQSSGEGKGMGTAWRLPRRGEVKSRGGRVHVGTKRSRCASPGKQLKLSRKELSKRKRLRGRRGQTLLESDPGLSLASALQQQACTPQHIMK